MDGGGGSGDLGVTVDGVVLRVHRRVAGEGVPAFEYVLASNRPDPVDLLISQPLPASIDREAIGFAADATADWTIRDDEWLTFQCRLAPGDRVTTAWGVRSSSHPPIQAPTLHVTEAGDAADPTAAEEASDAVEQAAREGAGDAVESTAVEDAGHADGSTAVEDAGHADVSTAAEDAARGADPAVIDDASGPSAATGPERSADTRDPSDAVDRVETGVGPTEADEATSRARESSVGAGAAEDPQDATVVRRLLRELEAGDVPERDRRALREALGAEDPASPDVVVEQLQALQRHHNQLTEAIELLEERVETVRSGTPTTTEINRLKRLIATLHDESVQREELTALQERVAALDERAVDAEAIRDVRGAIAQLEHDAGEEVAEEVAELREALAALEDRAATVDRVEQVREDVDQVAERIDAVEASTPERAAVDALEGDLEALAARTADLEAAVADLADAREDPEVEELAAAVEDLEARLGDLADRAAAADALETVNERVKQVEQGVLGYESLRDRVETVEDDTQSRLEETEDALAELRAAVPDEQRIEAVPTEDDVEVTARQAGRAGALDVGLLGVGVLGVAASLPVATVSTPLALATGAAGVAALLGRRVLRDR